MPKSECRSTVHLLSQTGRVKGVEIASNGHLADVEFGGEFGHADCAVASEFAKDDLSTMTGESPSTEMMSGPSG